LKSSVDGGFPIKGSTLLARRSMLHNLSWGHNLLEKTRKLIEINFYANLNRARTQLKQSSPPPKFHLLKAIRRAKILLAVKRIKRVEGMEMVMGIWKGNHESHSKWSNVARITKKRRWKRAINSTQGKLCTITAS